MNNQQIRKKSFKLKSSININWYHMIYQKLSNYFADSKLKCKMTVRKKLIYCYQKPHSFIRYKYTCSICALQASLQVWKNNRSTKEKNVHNLTRSISVSSLRYHHKPINHTSYHALIENQPKQKKLNTGKNRSYKLKIKYK